MEKSRKKLPAGWEMKTLGEVCEIKPSKSEARSKLVDTDLVSFVPMENLGIETKYFEHCLVKELHEVIGSYTYFCNGDVLLAKITPCFENGKLGIADNLVNGTGFGSSEFIVYRPNQEIKSEYLYYFLSQSTFREIGAQRMVGAVGHKRIPKDFYELSEIPIPPLPEQQRIVAKLDEAFAEIAAAKANIERNLQNCKEVFQSELNAVFANKNEKWEQKKLGDLGTITSSKRIYKNEYTENGIPFYRTKEIKELSNHQDISLELYISKERYNEIKSNYGIPQIGDILLSAVGTIGEILVIYNDDEFYFKDGNILWLKNFNNLNSYYLKYALLAFVDNIKALSIGSAYNALTIEKLKEYKILYPSKEQQENIVSRLDYLKEQTDHLEQIYQQKLYSLEELKKSILQKAFSGEL